MKLPLDAASSDVKALDGATLASLQAFNFDLATFEGLRTRLRSLGTEWPETRIGGALAPLAPGDVTAWPSGEERARWESLGLKALADGEVAVVILAGGMATRFGGGVKAAVPAFGEHSFLDLKLADVRAVARRAGGRVAVLLMASVATRDTLVPLARAASTEEVPVLTFNQCASLRLLPDGRIYKDAAGAPSIYATGHGDLVDALRGAALPPSGVRYIVVSNVDNLGASLEPIVIGAHIAGARPVTVEVVSRHAGDVGGAMARVDGAPQIVESFRLPPESPLHDSPIFNTNTFVFDAKALTTPQPFSFFPVKKTVEGVGVIQFERLLGQITAFLPTQILHVPREGGENRFIPIKLPTDLQSSQGDIAAVLLARRTLEDGGLVSTRAG